MGVFDPGKGSIRRPKQVTEKEYDNNWDSINWSKKGDKNEKPVSKQKRRDRV